MMEAFIECHCFCSQPNFLSESCGYVDLRNLQEMILAPERWVALLPSETEMSLARQLLRFVMVTDIRKIEVCHLASPAIPRLIQWMFSGSCEDST